MNHLSRPCLSAYCLPGAAALFAAGICLALIPPAARAQAHEVVPFADGPNAALANSSGSGYLGVDLADVDQGKAQALKLKEAHGAVITLIDHDAPAGKSGLKVNDVVLAINGQNVESADQLRRVLRDLPPGRKINLSVSRDGNIQTMSLQLADRRAVEHDVWGKIGSGSGSSSSPAMGLLGNGGKPSTPGSFHMPIFVRSLNIGALVEPLTSQMAEQLGVEGGIMVKQVAGKSDAATAGLKALDVILKVGQDPIKTAADWDRSLRSNQGKSVQVTILRDKKQQTLTLLIDSKHRSAVEREDLFSADEPRIMAELNSGFSAPIDKEALDALQAEVANAQAQAEKLSKQLGATQFKMSPEQADELRRQTDKLRESLKDIKVDPGQMKQFQRQMDELRKNLPDQKMMEQLREQMNEFRRQMEEWNARRNGEFA